MKTVAVIPVALGSKRIKDKNLLLVDGEPLIHYVLRAAIESNAFDEIYVDSEHDVFESIAKSHNVKFRKRPKDKGGSECYMCNISSNCKGTRCQIHDHYLYSFMTSINADYVVQIHTTSPLITSKTISNFVEQLHTTDTLIGVEDHKKESLFQNLPINFSTSVKTPTQHLTPLKTVCWALTGWNSETFKNTYENDLSPTFSGKIKYFNIPKIEALDVDTHEELFIAEACLNHLKRKDNVGKHYYDPKKTLGIDRDVKKLIEEDGSPIQWDINNRRKTSIEEIKDIIKDQTSSFPVVWTDNDQVFLIQQSPGEGCRYHYHPTKDEWWVIFEGEFLYEIDGEEPFKAKKGDIIFIEKGKAHKMTCVGNERGIRLACGENNFSHVYVKENDKPFGFN